MKNEWNETRAVFNRRFESAYGAHSRDEAELLDRLARALDRDDQIGLAEQLLGLA
jgi:hypothetical protein